MADAINNMSDSASSLITLVGFRIARKPADHEHPYGHERFEYISGFLVSILIIVVGFQFLLSSVQKILHPESTSLNLPMLIILILSISIKFFQSAFYKEIGQAIESNTMKTLAQDSKNDVLTTIVVIIGALIEWVSGWQCDGYFAFILSIYILFSGIKMIRESISDLMGRKPARSLIQQAVTLLDQNEALLGYHDLLIHQYGQDNIFATVDVELPASMSIKQAHDIIEIIEETFNRETSIKLSIHIDPVDLNDSSFITLHDRIRMLVRSLGYGLDIHDFRVNSNHEKPIVYVDVVVPETCVIDHALLEQKVKSLLRSECDLQDLVIVFDYHDLISEINQNKNSENIE